MMLKNFDHKSKIGFDSLHHQNRFLFSIINAYYTITRNGNNSLLANRLQNNGLQANSLQPFHFLLTIISNHH